jgi:N-acetylmuramoyl-L-alanine amidase
VAGAIYLVALVVVIVALHGGGPGGARPARPADDPAPVASAPAPVPATPRGDAAPLPPVDRRAPVKTLPRVPPSLDPLAAEKPVPPEPDTSVLAPLGDCCSEPRGTAPIDAIVIHVTESPDRPGTTDLSKLARFLAGRGLAAHAADDAEGNSARMVADDRLAYHATYWNRGTVAIEQVAYATLSRDEWLKQRRPQLDTTAAWIAHWARLYRIPIRRCKVAGLRYNRRKRVIAGTIVERGVCSHAELDPRNRDDPGPGYPWDYVLAKAIEVASRA